MNTKEIELIIDGKSNRSNIGKAWQITKFLGSVGWLTSKFIVKNTPTVLGAAWQIKKEISDEIAQTIHDEKVALKQSQMDDKLLQFKQLNHLKKDQK